MSMNSEWCLDTPLTVNVPKCICSNTPLNNDERALSVEEKLNNISFDMLPLSISNFLLETFLAQLLEALPNHDEKKYIYTCKQSQKLIFRRTEVLCLPEILKRFHRQSDPSQSFSSFIFQRFKVSNDLPNRQSLLYIQKEMISNSRVHSIKTLP